MNAALGSTAKKGEMTMKLFKVAIIVFVFVVPVTWADNLTGPQKNAVRSAEQYLSFQGFSRSGLIKQLSSDFGDGYSRQMQPLPLIA
ncbi:Ltp family lipoprotein [Nitrincola sp. A-D6]|uniref:Ltp family lipoprotein n=1 Tax=Nitrincola sp. A-D6 TaxID=1545442 RepID=UPI00190F714E|nr:Ltp family lipoprotein [Nitrincola sp. A-D6]